MGPPRSIDNNFKIHERINDSPFLSFENQQKYKDALESSRQIEELEYSLEDEKPIE